jgi:hypothetical protein
MIVSGLMLNGVRSSSLLLNAGIFIDASWLERKKPHHSSAIIALLKADGFDVTVVFDRPSRHHSNITAV